MTLTGCPFPLATLFPLSAILDSEWRPWTRMVLEAAVHSEGRGFTNDCRKECGTRNQENTICHKEQCVFGQIMSCLGVSVSLLVLTVYDSFIQNVLSNC